MFQQLVLYFSCRCDTDHELHNCPWDVNRPNYNSSVTRRTLLTYSLVTVCMEDTKESYLNKLDNIPSSTLDALGQQGTKLYKLIIIQTIQPILTSPKNSSIAQTNILVDAISVEDDDNKTVTHSNCVMNTDIQMNYDIFDSGTTSNFLLSDAPMINKQPTTNPLCISITDDCTFVSTHTCLLNIPQFL